MVVRLSAERKQNAKDLVFTGTTFLRALRQFLPVLWATIDAEITAHIHQRFEGKNDWEDLHEPTLDLRTLALRGEAPRRGRSKKGRLYYDLHRPSVKSPLSPRAFGWTLITQKDVAEAPGKYSTFELKRDFAKGTNRGKLLRYWHFGTKTRVTPKVRAWLHAHGVHLSPRTTQLVRPPRPIYEPSAVDGIVQKRGEQWLDRLVGVLDPQGKGLRFLIVNGRPGGI